MSLHVRVLLILASVTLAASPLSAVCTLPCAANVPASATTGVPVSFAGAAAPCGCGQSPSYSWSFGDGENASGPESSIAHTYSSPGTYSWQLTVSADGTTCTKSGSIQVTGSGTAPAAGTYVGSTSYGQFELTVNSSQQITQWTVYYTNFCYGSGSSTSNTTCSISNGSFTCGSAYCAPYAFLSSISGNFTSATTVSGTVTMKRQPDPWSSCCSASPSFSATLSSAPLTASASADVSTGAAPLQVSFTGSASGGTPPYSYLWDFGDCSGTSTEQSPSHSYDVGHWFGILTVTDSSSNTAQSFVPIDAQAGPAAILTVEAPAAATRGTPVTFTVTAKDAGGHVATSYGGQVAFTSSDPSATLPAQYQFIPEDTGVHNFVDGATFATAGMQTLTATDTSTGTITGSASVDVRNTTSTAVTSTPNPTAQGAAASLTATVTSGAGGTITGTVTFKDGASTLGSSSLSSGIATLSTSSLSAGPHLITAEYSGDSTFFPSTSPGHTHYVLISAPVVTAQATASTTISVTWTPVAGAADYEVLRSNDNVSFASLGIQSSPFGDTVPLNSVRFYKVRGRDSGANWGPLSASDVATAVTFSDEPIAAHVTKVKADHIAEARLAVNAMRVAAGLPPVTFSDVVAPGTVILTSHIQQLRDALSPSRTPLFLAPVTFTDPVLAARGTSIKALHLQEIRNAVK